MGQSDKLPSVEFQNLFEVDQFGQKFWSALLTPETFKQHRLQFVEMGRSGALATPLSKVADAKPPELKQFNARGERVDEIVYHPAHAELEKLSYGKGIISQKYQTPLVDRDQRIRHQVGFATGFYFAQTETGIFCPICMTDALGFVLERYKGAHPESERAVKKALKHIGSKNPQEAWQGAMFLTEIQGGSDVGANAVRAEKMAGAGGSERWLLFGDKWFCSNVDAKAALVLARLPGEEGDLKHGTKGLGLFLVLRDEPLKNHSSWVVNRLKDKLGVKSMASGEVSFNGTEGFLLAGHGEGFKMMAEMVNMSRLYNSVASLGIARRSLLEAKAFGERRAAFGSALTELPLWRACFSDIAAEFVLLKTLAFETIKALDLGETGDEEQRKLSRVLTPVCKALTGKLSVFAAAECMELIGGNAYIEDHILPRLLRDAQVLPIWEGTTQIQSLDLLRSFKKEGVDALQSRLAKSLQTKGSGPEFDKARQIAAGEQKKLMGWLQELSNLSPQETMRASRNVLEQVGRTVGLSFVLELSAHEALREVALATIKRVAHRPQMFTGPAGSYSPHLAQTESVFIREF